MSKLPSLFAASGLLAGVLTLTNVLSAAAAPTPATPPAPVPPAATTPVSPAPPAGSVPARGPAAAPAKPDTSKLPAPATKTGLTYTKDIQPMFQEHCGTCHAAARPRGGFDLAALATVLKTTRNREVVIVGKSEDSPLVWYVADLVPRKEMPPLTDREKVKPLSQEQIALVRAWIDQGAK